MNQTPKADPMGDPAGWPKLDDAARLGIVGGFLDVVESESEADAAGMLFDFLACFGNAVGVSPTMPVQADVHRPGLFVATVGRTSRGRKGTGRSFVRRTFMEADPGWAKRCVVSGHASGEGIVADLDVGRDDPRRLIEEAEFSRVLRVAGRDGSILSETLRRAWDGLPLANRRASDRIVVNRHHLSIVGNITQAELDDALSRTDSVNGFANRFLWVLTTRARRLPRGGALTDDDFRRLGREVREVLSEARRVTVMRRSNEADELWSDWYLGVPDDVAGLWGAATARAEAQVLRLQMIYALGEASRIVERRHVEAAIAAWRYCDDSARIIFGDKTGNRDVDKLVDALEIAREQGLDRTRQHRLFRNHPVQAANARERSLQLGLTVEVAEPTGGRPRQVLYLNRHAPEMGAGI